MADEQQRADEAEVLSDYEARCLRAAYTDLFGQEYALTQQAAPSPVETSWATK